MPLPPPPCFDREPAGKPAVREWLLERARDVQGAAGGAAEVTTRIGRLLDADRGERPAARAPHP